MFEQEPEQTTEQKHSRAILWMGAATVVLITVLIVLLARSRPQNSPVVDNVVRAGAAEFDTYKDKVELEVVDKITHPNMVGMFQLEVRAKLHNRGDRALTGIEVLGQMLDMSDKVIAQTLSLPIPRTRQAPLKPGESMDIRVKVDAPSKVTENDVKDIVIALYGLRF